MAYVLEELTDPLLIDYTRERNSEVWRGDLDKYQYVTAKYALLQTDITSSYPNRMVVFAMIDKNTGSIVSSIELLIRKSWRFSRNSNGSVWKEAILSGCVAGVFTFPENRRQGLATLMVGKLVNKAKEYIGDGFMTLYSEVGEFYARNGFKSYHVPLVRVEINKQSPNALKVELIKYHQFEGLMEQYREEFLLEMEQNVLNDGVQRVFVDPTSSILDWFHLRSKYWHMYLFGTANVDPYSQNYEEQVREFSKHEPGYFGLKVMDSTNIKGFIVWYNEYGKTEHKSIVLKLHVFAGYDKDETAKELLDAMKGYYSEDRPQHRQFNTIELWVSELSERLLGILKDDGAKVVENPDLSAILVMEDHNRLENGEIIWADNTKLPWV